MDDQAKKIPGFVGKRRVRRLECDWFEPEEGAEALWADVNVKMSIDQMNALGELLASNPTMAQLWEVLTPRVVAWNALAEDLATGEYVPVPPPAEAGEASFRAVDALITSWLAFALKATSLGRDVNRPKASASTPAPSSASG